MCKIFKFERSERINEDINQLLPVLFYYFNIGKSLQGLSQYEYNTFLYVNKIPKSNNGE